jgi:primosomal protein N'
VGHEMVVRENVHRQGSELCPRMPEAGSRPVARRLASADPVTLCLGSPLPSVPAVALMFDESGERHLPVDAMQGWSCHMTHVNIVV